MRSVIFAFALTIGLAPLAQADETAAIRTLAEQGDGNAQLALGTMYRDGHGVQRNYTETIRWWEEAAKLGVVDAQFALGNLYAGGSGIPRDNTLAYQWYGIAALQAGDNWLQPIAASNRDAIAARMTPEEIFEAQQRVTEWRAQYDK
jgi:TPR repeat protein